MSNIIKNIGKLSFGILSGILLLIYSNSTMAQDHWEMKIVHLSNKSDEDEDGFLVAKDYIENHSNGQIKVTIYAGGQLCGSAKECTQSLQSGVIEGFNFTPSGMAITYPEAQIIALPYLLNSDIIAERVLNGPFLKKLASGILKTTQNIRLLAIGNTGGWRNFANSKRDIHVPSDLKGLKIRTVTSKINQMLVKLTGAAPTPIPWPETYTALQTGVVDGSKNGMTDIISAKFHEVMKHITLDAHSYMASLLVVNNDWYKSLPLKLQAVVTEAFIQAAAVTNAVVKTKRVQANAEFVKAGGTIYVPTKEEKQKFIEMAKPIKQWFIQTYGNELLNEYEKYIQIEEKKLSDYQEFQNNLEN